MISLAAIKTKFPAPRQRESVKEYFPPSLKGKNFFKEEAADIEDFG